MIRSSRTRRLLPLLVIGLAAMLGGCVAYPAYPGYPAYGYGYGGGYQGGPYYSGPYAGGGVVTFGSGGGGGWHRGWHNDWHDRGNW
jgi:hypothetical protein